MISCNSSILSYIFFSGGFRNRFNIGFMFSNRPPFSWGRYRRFQFYFFLDSLLLLVLLSHNKKINTVNKSFKLILDTIPPYLRWLSYIAYVRYGFEGTLLAIYGFDRPNLHCSEAYCHYKSPIKFLEEFDVRFSLYWVDFVVLFSFFIVLRLVAFLVLKWKLRSQN